MGTDELSEKQARWRKRSEDRKLGGLLLGGVHGIPSSQHVKTGSLWKKRPRDVYFRQLRKVCSEADVVVVHSNPKLPGQAEIDGPDAPKIYDTFMQGSAKLLVHGHMHTQEVVTVNGNGKVVVNCDCRVVVLVPGSSGAGKNGTAIAENAVPTEVEITDGLQTLGKDATVTVFAAPVTGELESEGSACEACDVVSAEPCIVRKKRW